MSIKVYSGFTLARQGMQAVPDLLAAVAELRGICKPMAQQIMDKMFTTELVCRFDDALITGEGPKSVATVIAEVMQERAKDRERLKKHERAPWTDSEFSLVLFQTESAGLIGYMRTEHEKMRRAMYRMEQVRDFSCWTNTDKDETVPEDEWAERIAAWDDVVYKTDASKTPVISVPALGGPAALDAIEATLRAGATSLQVVVVAEDEVTPKFLSTYTPIMGKRLERLATAALVEAAVKRGGERTIGAYTRALSAVRDALDAADENAIAEFETLKAAYRKVIVPAWEAACQAHAGQADEPQVVMPTVQ